ncbi:hypothetical protein D8B29_19680 [Verminephrobacter eiseniae]|nr:hypothetical protein [Verminephrobacter eiseniae]MCW5304541.1 hypothetical protein [Verminephrobacter eiseniae]MCW8181720.1 hypothetical protein [Verminephrobacter eiseniae]MCW8191969.1 hypothetical protein [Verminephrobacter eiseniae]
MAWGEGAAGPLHCIAESSVHCAGVACRTSVPSALRLRVHERFGRFGNGIRPRCRCRRGAAAIRGPGRF